MQKKAYRRPALQEYGPLATLTLGQTGGFPDCGSQDDDDGSKGANNSKCDGGGGASV